MEQGKFRWRLGHILEAAERIVDRLSAISKEDFLFNRPKDWETTLDFEKYFIIEGAKKVLIKIDDLKDAEGNPKKSNAMHEMSFVVWDKFQPF